MLTVRASTARPNAPATTIAVLRDVADLGIAIIPLLVRVLPLIPRRQEVPYRRPLGLALAIAHAPVVLVGTTILAD